MMQRGKAKAPGRHYMWFRRDTEGRIWVVCTCGWKAHHKRAKVQERKAAAHQAKHGAEWVNQVAGL